MSSFNPFTSWLRARGHWIARTGDTRTPTHVFLDGGKAAIPPSALPAMYEQYSMCLQRGIDQHCVERVPHTFRFFVDVDLSLEAHSRYGNTLVQQLIPVACDLLDCHSGTVVVCGKHATGPAALAKGGFHLIFEDVAVDRATAECVLQECLHRITCAPTDDLKKSLDASVYNGSGLRMIFSKKKGGNDVYVPTHVATCGRLDALDPHAVRLDVPTWLRRCSLTALTPGCALQHVSATVSTTVGATVGASASNGSNGSNGSRDVSEATAQLLQDSVPSQYQPCRVKIMRRSSPQGDSFLLSSNSKFCANVGRCHGSNHVFFVVTKSGVYQRCHSTKEACNEASIKVGEAPSGLFQARVALTEGDKITRQLGRLALR